MRIHGDFTGGNIRVLSVEGNLVRLQNELRDTTGDWFYWAFCVEGAQGETISFQLDKPWLGYHGPAVSHDLLHWQWLGVGDEHGFSYAFGSEENRVYFAHDMLYHPAHFDRFCKVNGLRQEALCQSEQGHEVPCVRFGEGAERLLLTARHHACESTGDFVLEGVLHELRRQPIPGLEVIAVPFMDFDGVINGDQGKNRAPYDHNRDYQPDQPARYASVKAVRDLAMEKPLRYAFDFHSPWHLGHENDHVFIPLKTFATQADTERFAAILERVNTSASLPYEAFRTLLPGIGWNQLGTPSFGTYMHVTAGAELAFTLETPYFQCGGVPFAPERARELGRCFATALREYHITKGSQA